MKVLVVGLGAIGQRHVRNLRALRGDAVDIHAVRARGLTDVLTEDMEIARGEDVEKRYGIVRETDLRTALARGPHAVFVTNPSSLHVPVAVAAAQAGCHLFIEKPLSHDLADVATLVDVVERRRLVALVGYQLRFHPCWRKVQALLEDRTIGTLLAVRFEIGEYLPAWHRYEDYRTSYAARRALGGGVVLSQIHELDLACWLFGMPRRVFAIGGHWSDLEVDVEDTASILLECTWDARPLPVHVHMDYVQQPPSRRCEIVGDRGKITVNLRRAEVCVVDRHGGLETYGVPDVARNDLFLAELRHFLACLDGRETPIVSAREGARSLEIALAAKRSMASGAAVALG